MCYYPYWRRWESYYDTRGGIKEAGVMLESTIINHRQHVGLQKLSALAGITHSSLGPNKKYKFIQDDASGESALVVSCFRILENLEVSCAVGQLVYEAIQAHQKVYHTGSGGLLFLAGAWSRVALECLRRGVSVANIISGMREGLEMCLDVCWSVSMPTESLGADSGLCRSKKKAGESLSGLGKTEDSLKACGKRKIKLSRHFCDTTFEKVSTELEDHKPKLQDVAERLSHGCSDAMNLVIQASRIQSQNSSCSNFDITKVMTCLLPGSPEAHACVTPGCILLLPADHASFVHHLKDRPLKVALIQGDLSFNFRHLGFKRLKGVESVSKETDLSSNKEEEWMEKVMTVLLSLEVNLILVTGLVSEKVIQRCLRHHVLAVEKVNAAVLRALADASGAVPVTYATQLSKHCVGNGVNVDLWKDLSSYERKPLIAVNVSAGRDSKVVTVILSSCIEGKLQALEDQFWACAYRLHHALKDKALLPGAGVTEIFCIHRLQKLQTKAEAVNPYRSEVLQLMADGLVDYISTVMVNSGRFSKVQAWTAVNQQLKECHQRQGTAVKFSGFFLEGAKEDVVISTDLPPTKVNDNLSVKQEVWRKALDLVFLVLQTDVEVITGIDQKAKNGEDGTMML